MADVIDGRRTLDMVSKLVKSMEALESTVKKMNDRLAVIELRVDAIDERTRLTETPVEIHARHMCEAMKNAIKNNPLVTALDLRAYTWIEQKKDDIAKLADSVQYYIMDMVEDDEIRRKIIRFCNRALELHKSPIRIKDIHELDLDTMRFPNELEYRRIRKHEETKLIQELALMRRRIDRLEHQG